MSHQGAARDPRRRGPHVLILRTFAGAQLIPTVIFIAFLIGSLLLSGSQALPDDRPRYDVIVPFPIFVVPEWVSVFLGVVAAALVVPLLVTTKIVQAPQLNAAFAYSIGATVANLYFAFTFPASSGMIAKPSDPMVYLGAHWIGAALAAACVVVVAARAIPFSVRYDRLRRAGLISDMFVPLRDDEPGRFEIQVPAGWTRSDVAGRPDTWRYRPSASDPRVPAMDITLTSHRTHRGDASTRERRTERAEDQSRTLTYGIAAPGDPRHGLVFTTVIAGGDRASVEACVSLSDRIMESFRWI
ncbi:hypothetical protein J7E25_16565 [Agromyces sp. ISL-38]|uniref:hypothetical protein n=1 Tax=Agromyces sp. ISL-38 TaxID=2819107 RepID=UPI001BEA09B7|nr:hypothetical protein [Agromyces sp. ISL-38]MBT2500710.1 hypothetical protein [Agromyces sp. ISL-38]MBT2516693.1 hypothetical protein [Streptomyces sp. ISL-90]